MMMRLLGMYSLPMIEGRKAVDVVMSAQRTILSHTHTYIDVLTV